MWLLTYGFAKVPPQQFTMPGADLLLRTYGDSSPMGLLWTFMGFSPAYTMFAGLAELVPGFLLLFRRTATLGALVGTATMLNVVVLNFCYDVPVKLFSAHLLAALVVIALPDVPRLVNLFVLNRPVAARPALNLPWWQNVTMLALKSAYLLLFLGTSFYGAYGAWQGYRAVSAPPPLAGIYDAAAAESGGPHAMAPVLTGSQSRHRVLERRRPRSLHLAPRRCRGHADAHATRIDDLVRHDVEPAVGRPDRSGRHLRRGADPRRAGACAGARLRDCRTRLSLDSGAAVQPVTFTGVTSAVSVTRP
jgi:hypothetical protein